MRNNFIYLFSIVNIIFIREKKNGRGNSTSKTTFPTPTASSKNNERR